jgi:hypothetical protein
MELKRNYNDEDFEYSCPECRGDKKQKKKRDKKGDKKKKPATKPGNSENKRPCPDNSSSYFSNSGDNESQKYKNTDYAGDANMVQENSDEDQNMKENSEFFQMSTEKKTPSDNDHDSVQRGSSNQKENETFVRKTSQKACKKPEMVKKAFKKKSKDSFFSGYKRKHDSLEQLTRNRSFNIAKEREDIVDQRNLASKVSVYCGITAAQIQERIEHDILEIQSAIELSEKSDVDEQNETPSKS